MTDITYQEAIHELGRDNVTATFGCSSAGGEIVGPLKPEAVYYGQAFGYDTRQEQFATHKPIPLVMFTFNKYRPDLPPWDAVQEFVLASRHPQTGNVVEYTFIEAHHRGNRTTGDTKTVEMSASGPSQGVDATIITRSEVAEKRDMPELPDESSYEVNKELF